MSQHVHAIRWHHHRLARRGAFGTPVAVEDWNPSRVRPRDAPTDSCKPGDTSAACELPAGASSKLPMILGALFPILTAAVVLFFLHRRHMRRLKLEDATDKTKSMDFGMDIGPAHASRMAALSAEKADSRSRRQMSMDMDIVASPYLLPTAVNGSHDSLARTVHGGDDRYGRPVGPLSPSTHLPRRRDSSIYTRSIRPDDSPDGSHSINMEAGLLDGAQRMPTSTPPPPRSASLAPSTSAPVPQINLPMPPRAKSPSSNEVSAHTREAFERHSQEPAPQSSNGGNGIPTSLHARDSTPPPRSESPFADPVINLPPSDNSDAHLSQRRISSEYGEGIQFRFSDASIDENEIQKPSKQQQSDDRKSLAPVALDTRRLSMGFRPLPPDGNPDDTAEERAMRIRSFYKEYFSADEAPPPIPQPPAQYQDEYSQEYSMGFDDHTVFDSETGRFIVPGADSKPFAEPPTRRAMTPPPRMPPRFMGPGPGPRSRAGSSAGGRFIPPDARSYSSASGRMPGRPQQRRPLEPPKPLNLLPTPAMVSEDAFASPHMFAPPVRVKRDESDSNSLRGGVRPYSPSVSPHVPLASAFDDLAVMPSPHMLRKSSTFTALDFAPPRKFKNDGGEMSDAGSIRSNRSGTSALQVQNIRNGAYRVSRIPTDVVPLKDDMTSGLKPTWDLGYGKSG
ncbi:hypothetical protein K440DRAFT_256733 [Wilcoxina mikolae CBS 423.85]|nr:hypothetical protein K440DRAFT_256733 [Wilcoxina mikolae CBS 423.85]